MFCFFLKNLQLQLEFFDQYQNYFDNPKQLDNVNTALLAFPILIKAEAPFTRRQFQTYLEERNIQTRVVFTGNILRQPMSKKFNYRTNGLGFPNADIIMEGGVLLIEKN